VSIDLFLRADNDRELEPSANPRRVSPCSIKISEEIPEGD
jgi:hypothetical protein